MINNYRQLKMLLREAEDSLDTTKYDDYKKVQVINDIRDDMSDEFQAIRNYEDHAEKAEAAGFDDVAKVIRDIADEEKVHTGELQAVLSKHDDVFEKSVEDGKKEAEEEIHEEDETNMEEKEELSDKEEEIKATLGNAILSVIPDNNLPSDILTMIRKVKNIDGIESSSYENIKNFVEGNSEAREVLDKIVDELSKENPSIYNLKEYRIEFDKVIDGLKNEFKKS